MKKKIVDRSTLLIIVPLLMAFAFVAHQHVTLQLILLNKKESTSNELIWSPKEAPKSLLTLSFFVHTILI